MTRQAWLEFICAPDRAGRHLSAIGKGVGGAASEAIDLAALQSFLEKLHNCTSDVNLLATAVDLVTGEYSTFTSGALHRIVDALSNEMISQEQRIGPALRGNPRWDRTIVQRISGSLPATHYISRTSHRSFDLPENQLLAWLVENLRKSLGSIEQLIGTHALHKNLQDLKKDCERSQRHHWFSDIIVPSSITPEMMSAASRHRRPEYRTAANLSKRRLDMEGKSHDAWWYNVMALLAVNWLEPVSDDDLFELFTLILVLDIISEELGFGEPIEYGLVTHKRGHIALFDDGARTIKVYFDQSPTSFLPISTEYNKVIRQYAGVSGNARRPDICIVCCEKNETRLLLVEMKKTSDSRYISDSIYKAFGYLYDFRRSTRISIKTSAILVIPTGVSSALPPQPDMDLFIASSDDRAGLCEAVRHTLFA